MPAPFSGGCLCGAVRYESSAEPVFSISCHWDAMNPDLPKVPKMPEM